MRHAINCQGRCPHGECPACDQFRAAYIGFHATHAPRVTARPCTCGAAPIIEIDDSGRYLVECHECVDGAIDAPARPWGQNRVEASAISDWNDAILDALGE